MVVAAAPSLPESGAPADCPQGARGPDPAGAPEPSLRDLYRRLRSSEQGLPTAEACRRLAAGTPNEPTAAQQQPWIRAVLGFFANPLVLILLVASLVSAL